MFVSLLVFAKNFEYNSVLVVEYIYTGIDGGGQPAGLHDCIKSFNVETFKTIYLR